MMMGSVIFRHTDTGNYFKGPTEQLRVECMTDG